MNDSDGTPAKIPVQSPPISGKKLKKDKQALRSLMNTIPDGNELFDTIIYMLEEQRVEDPARDRNAAIMGGVIIEHAFRVAISRYLKTSDDEIEHEYLFKDEDAPYREFSSRARLARALGIISKDDFNHIEIIRLIRNSFAHSILRISFKTPEISSLLNRIDIQSDLGTFAKWCEIVFPKHTLLSATPTPKSSRSMFVYIVFKYYWQLVNHSPRALREALESAEKQS